jgi:hypothetical protein
MGKGNRKSATSRRPRRPAYGEQIVMMSESERLEQKYRGKNARRRQEPPKGRDAIQGKYHIRSRKGYYMLIMLVELDGKRWRQAREQQLRAAASRPLVSGTQKVSRKC